MSKVLVTVDSFTIQHLHYICKHMLIRIGQGVLTLVDQDRMVHVFGPLYHPMEKQETEHCFKVNC